VVGALQIFERHERCFVSTQSVALATGVIHCWAVTYALIFSLVLQAMRVTERGAHPREQLPSWVILAEKITAISAAVWCVASMLLFSLRVLVVDEQQQGLPVDFRDTALPWLWKVARAPVLRRLVRIAHNFSCLGVFVGIVLLCCAIASLCGAISSCQICMVCIAVCFTVPHLALAVSPGPCALGLASEAATLGPQLCVLLACFDTMHPARAWHRLLWLATTVSFLLMLVVRARVQGKHRTCPTLEEVLVLIVVDIVAALAIGSFQNYRSRESIILAFIFLLAGGTVAIKPARDALIEIIEPIMPLHRTPGAPSDAGCVGHLGRVQRILAVICGIVAFWNIASRQNLPAAQEIEPVQQWEFDHTDGDFMIGGDGTHDANDGMDDFLWEETYLLFRWSASAGNLQEPTALSMVAQTLAVPVDTVYPQAVLSEHHVMVFQYSGEQFNYGATVKTEWQNAVQTPNETMSDMVGTRFPAHLNTSICKQITDDARNGTEPVHYTTTYSNKTIEIPVLSAESRGIMSVHGIIESDIQDTYFAVCNIWQQDWSPTYPSRSDDWDGDEDYEHFQHHDMGESDSSTNTIQYEM